MKHQILALMIVCFIIAKSFRIAPKQFSFNLYQSNNYYNIATTQKVIVVTGGVISGIGKGVTVSSIGVLVKMLGLRPTAMKIDPYLNVDAGTMSPFEHGETFVLDDGAETDLDLGNYERFMDLRLSRDSSLTTGKVYQSVIAKERRGDYLGKTVQIIPHVTDEIMTRVLAVLQRSVDGAPAPPDVCIVELGGTIGDIESMPFVEAIRQLHLRLGPQNLCIVHVSMVPTVGEGSGGEQKTKPTQHSVKELRSLGLAPDFIVCRSRLQLEVHARTKISLFCNVPVASVLTLYDLTDVYQAPLLLAKQGFLALLRDRLALSVPPVTESAQHSSQPCTQSSPESSPHSSESLVPSAPQGLIDSAFYARWREMAEQSASLQRAGPHAAVTIAVVGKYTSLGDAYLSLVSAIKHSAVATGQRLQLLMIESSQLEMEALMEAPESYTEAWRRLRAAHGVVVAGGFGVRGTEGKILAVRHAREGRVPFLGICLGMQMAVVEYCRHVLNLPGAASEEFAADRPFAAPLAVVFMPEGDRAVMGGTMRLGARQTAVRSGSLASDLYCDAARGDDGSLAVEERHRHRYEVNPELVAELEAAGLIFSGRDSTGERMEIVELARESHPYFIGVQFHPEFNSRPLRPAPTFLGLLRASLEYKNSGRS